MRKKHFQTHVHFKSRFFFGGGWSSTFSGVQFGMLPAGIFFKRKMGPVSATKKNLTFLGSENPGPKILHLKMILSLWKGGSHRQGVHLARGGKPPKVTP